MENLEAVCCPVCGGGMIRRGNKRRKVRAEDGATNIYSLKRYWCETCGKLHTEIPDFIEPYKHYNKETINKVRGGNTETFWGDESTIKRWQAEK
ncbi:DUF6431 domain-containing protein [Ruminococcus sp. 5_1_39BFAA]|uniref:DUF6431 domain-containing protein n=1 Tax=Ruminococcus sp. 5_1_39BFAA TaxID=457412 RepID=UPI003569CDDF